MNESLENLKESVTRALISALEDKNVPMAKQLFTIYYEVQQMSVPSSNVFSFNMNGDTLINSGYTNDIINNYKSSSVNF